MRILGHKSNKLLTMLKLPYGNFSILLFSIVTLLLLSCQTKPKTLPYIGQTKIVDGDTVYHKIPSFSFTDQDGNIITETTFEDHIYVADFFFTHCPTICPRVMKQMMRINDKYKNNSAVKLVSHTIDPKNDTEEVLKIYADKLDISSKNWHLLRGDKYEMLDHADAYYVVAYEDESIAGGFDHSGKILLIDKDRHIRAFADGTDPETVTELLETMDVLLKEYETL